MREMFRRSTDGSILCRPCLPAEDVAVSAELFADLFPGTWHRVTCTDCGYSPPAAGAAEVEAEAELMAEGLGESRAGSLRSV